MQRLSSRGGSLRIWGALAGCLVAALASGIAYAASTSDGSAPPEIAAYAATGWPAHNYDLSNTRFNLQSDINSGNVAKLKPAWTLKFRYTGVFGAYTSNPVVQNNVVYIEDPDSNVYALNQQTGAVLWEHAYKSVTPSGGPNGVAVGYGLVFGATENAAFALDLQTGKQVWARKLTRNAKEGIDMAPQLFGNKVLISTIPGNSKAFYKGNAYGIVYALDAKTGATKWSFSTVLGGDKLWGNPKLNGGGGLWYPPGVDSQGRVFLAVANPSPWPNSPSNPNAKSRPGTNLYTDSLVALDGDTGKVLWHNQIVKHDLRDYDFQDPPIITNAVVGGTSKEIVISAGKQGKVVAFDATTGARIWLKNVGKHLNDVGPLPAKLATVCPGPLGGVETPMALAGGSLYVPIVNLCAKESATGLGTLNFTAGSGSLLSLNATTGGTNWQRDFKTGGVDVGAATVANDVVFTSTLDGTIYALSVKDGSTLWTTKAPAGINSFPAVTKNMLIVGAGSPLSAKSKPALVAYALPTG